MNKKIIVLIVSLIWQSCFAAEPNDVIKTIEKLNRAANNLKNLTAEIEYTHTQPLFETQTVRTGKIFYTKDAGSSTLRINFLTLKQDQSNKQEYKEDYFFDGMKLTRIDYQSKSVTTEQLAKDKPIEPFEIVQDYFPIIGLAKPDEMTSQFNISVKGNELTMIPKENSRFFKTYKQVYIKINPENNLPYDFSALTADDEKITIKLSQINTSKAVDKKVFELKIPAGFARMQDSNN